MTASPGNPAPLPAATTAENPHTRVHEYKSLLLLVLVVAAALAGGWYAFRHDAALDAVPPDQIRTLDKDNTLVISAGTAVQIRKMGNSALVRRYESPEEVALMGNLRKAMSNGEAAAGFRLTPLQLSTLRTMDFTGRPSLTTEQTEAVKAAFFAYSAATATQPATASALRSAPRKAEAERGLLAAVAAIDAGDRPYSVKLGRVRRIVTPEQFDALCGRKPIALPPAGSTQPETKPAK